MTQAQRKRTTVEVAVISHEPWRGKPSIKMNVPEWNSDYPTTIYNAPEEAQKALWLGFTGKVVLEGRLKDGKDADKPWNFFWDFVELVGGDNYAPQDLPPEPEQPPDDELFGEPTTLPTKREEVSFAAQGDAKQASIERQVAFKEAMGWVTHDSGELPTIEAMERVAWFTDIFEAILNRAYQPAEPDA